MCHGISDHADHGREVLRRNKAEKSLSAVYLHDNGIGEENWIAEADKSISGRRSTVFSPPEMNVVSQQAYPAEMKLKTSQNVKV